jgi:ribosomal protein S18 acetylase RimI-like enzyme
MIGVRMAQIKDISLISNVLAESWKTAYRGIVDDEYLDSIEAGHWEEFLTNGLIDGTVFSMVLLDNQDFAGACILSKSENHDEVHLVSLYLLPDRIGKGCGHRFYSEIENEIKKRGYIKCVLDVLTDNKRACRFYEAHGFADSGAEETTVIGGLEYPFRVFVKLL